MTADARERLLADRAVAVARIAAMTADLDAVAAAVAGSNLDDEHDPEGATIAFEREQFAALRGAAATQVREIDAALARVEGGTFGACESCGLDIGAERLAALPATRRCVACARRGRGSG